MADPGVTVAAAAPLAAQPLRLCADPAAAEGQRIFTGTCGHCHGPANVWIDKRVRSWDTTLR